MSRKGDNDRRSYDSSGQYGKVFSVAVVGLSGTEKDKGCLGVGKSCLCNRFVRPQADEYNRDHISVLSQTDFSGPIVNNEHWLYWGETRKCTEEGFELTFSVIEQTEFVDDACFQPFRSGKMEPYFKRCAATKLSSAEKLMYICKNQLGVEKEYEQHYLPDGRFNVDGFICVFDVSEIQGRDISRQIELTALILGTLLKSKKPVILVTTKNDEVYPPYMREAEKLVNRREFKGLIPLVETSAHDNVNVDLAFWACVQRDWTKGKSKILTYQDSFQRQRDRLEIVNDNYLSLIRSQITDYRSHWNNTYSNLSQSHDFLMYCDLFGQDSAQQTFKRHVKKLRDDYICRKMQMYLRILPKMLIQLLPDLDSFGPDQSWPAVQQLIRSHPLFDSNFVINEGLSWQEVDDSSESRIPFDLLSTAEAEKVFVDHRDSLLQEEHLRSLRHQFSELLRETCIAPGQPLKEIRLLLAERECVDSLPESELVIIYEDYQRMLQERAREQLLELFLERAPLFLQYCTGNMVTQEDLSAIAQKLMDDERWSALDLLPQDRDLALIRHLGFIQWPIKEHCPSYHACVDINTEVFCSSLAKRSRHPMWNVEPEEIRVKLTVLGASGLADNLANVVKAMRASLEQENSRVFLDVQLSSGSDGIGLLESRLYPNSLEPEAYLCVYSNRSSLEFVRKSLEQSLLTDLQFGNPHHANPVSIGLPLVLLLATSPETSAKERSYLREEGQNRAQSLQCAFFDVTSDEPHARFKPDELLRALIFLTDSVARRSDLMHVYSPATNSLNSIIPEGALNPEIRILLSLMCGDPILPAHFLELLLLPNSLPNTAFYPLSKHSIVTDVGFLVAIDEENEDADIDVSHVPSRYVEFVLTSYHGSYSYKEELLHGHILVYWSKRQASFSNMSAFASTVAPILPIQILALVENESRPSKLSHQLVADGQGLAQSLNAHFRVSTLSEHLGRCISSFLNFALQNKLQIEKGLQIAPTSVQSQAQQQSPGSAISNSNDECYDPNVDQHFGPMMVPPAHPLHHRPLHHEQDTGEPLSDSIYERLPDEQASAQTEPLKSGTYQHGLPSSLVRPVRGQGNSGKHVHAYGTGLIESENVVDETLPFFAPVYDGNHDEQLVKPSQIKQRRRLNYYNLQSYPSADSLDRVYSIDSTYSNYYANLGHMPPHYVHRPYAQHRGAVENAFVESPYGFDHHQPPPRPASSAHVMIPTHSSQPPPYSRVAVSPPPAYKMPSSYGYDPRQPNESLYPAHPYLPQSEFESSTAAYYQRKFYPSHHQAPPFRSYSPPFDLYSEDATEHYLAQHGMLRPDLVPNVTSYRHSPLIYATTSRNHHARSSHFHQLGSNPRHQFYDQQQPHPFDTVSPYAVGRSYTHRHHKKKKKHHSSKSRSSSSKGHRSSLVRDEEDDEEEDEDMDDDPSVEVSLEKSKKVLTKSRKRRTEEKSKKRKEKIRLDGAKEREDKDEDEQEVGERKKVADRKVDLEDDSDELEARDNEGGVEADDGLDEDEDETVSSNNSAGDRLINAAADRYAVSSGWAYHQTNNDHPNASSRQHFADQWPPPQQAIDDDNSSMERFKAPGKLDLKRFNNLSNAIGRLTLNSPGLPLGPTRAGANASFDGSDYTSAVNNKNYNFPEYSPEQLGVLASTTGHPRRGGRQKGKQFVGSKEGDSESETSDANLNDKLSTPNLSTAFSSVKPSSVIGSHATTGHQKKLQKNKRRIVPVPVAPPRLPQSANSSTAVTPTSSSNGRPLGFMAGATSSLDDSQQDILPSEASDTTAPTSTLDDIVDDGKTIDLEQSQLGETRRNRRQQMSKLFSLQSENDHSIGFSHDVPSMVAGRAALEDSGAKEAESSSDKKQVLKSKSVGTFSELDGGKKANRKAEKLEKKRQKEEERKSRKASKEAGARNRSRSKSTTNHSSCSPLEAFAQSNGNAVPLFIEKCTHFIELEGLDMEGIYRVPGNRAHVDTLLLHFDENPDINIADLDIPVNAVATALKDFLMKRLPPIFPPDCMEDIASLSRQYTDTGVLADIRTFLLRLPNANYQIIHFMIAHFAKVVDKSAINSMDSKNLAICWWPTLLQFEFSDMFVFEQMRPHLMNFVQILIDSMAELFTVQHNAKVNSSDETNLSFSADELASL